MTAAAVEVFARLLPDVSAALSTLLPGWLAPVSPFIAPAMAALSGLMLRWAAKYHKHEIKAALYEEPPDMINRAYKQ